METKPFDRSDSRAKMFSEEVAHWKFPMDPNQQYCDISVDKVNRKMHK